MVGHRDIERVRFDAHAIGGLDHGNAVGTGTDRAHDAVTMRRHVQHHQDGGRRLRWQRTQQAPQRLAGASRSTDHDDIAVLLGMQVVVDHGLLQ